MTAQTNMKRASGKVRGSSVAAVSTAVGRCHQNALRFSRVLSEWTSLVLYMLTNVAPACRKRNILYQFWVFRAELLLTSLFLLACHRTTGCQHHVSSRANRSPPQSRTTLECLRLTTSDVPRHRHPGSSAHVVIAILALSASHPLLCRIRGG